MRVKNPFSYLLFDRHDEVNTLPSMTVPDQSMSVRQILDRFARGLPLGGTRVASYEPDDVDDDDLDFIPDPKSLDLTERQDYKEQFEDELSEIKKRRYVKKDVIKKEAGSRSEDTQGDSSGSESK